MLALTRSCSHGFCALARCSGSGTRRELDRRSSERAPRAGLRVSVHHGCARAARSRWPAGVDYPLASELRAGVESASICSAAARSSAGACSRTSTTACSRRCCSRTGSPRVSARRAHLGRASAHERARRALDLGRWRGFSAWRSRRSRRGSRSTPRSCRRSGSPVRLGLEIGARQAFLEDENWTIASAQARHPLLSVHERRDVPESLLARRPRDCLRADRLASSD